MNKLTVLGLAWVLLVSTATKSNEFINTNYDFRRINSLSEPIKTELIDSLKIEMPEIKNQEPIKYKTFNFYKDFDEVLLARMILGEADNCSKIEKIAVAYTVLNRIKDSKPWNGGTLKEIILKPYQYSAFNEDRNAKLKNPLAYNAYEFLTSLKLAKEILNGKHKDPLGATHYINPNHPDLKGRPLPKWIKKLEPLGRIENSFHVFYREN